MFHYTPKHSSWLNQIEIWLGILGRKLLKRGNFTSVGDWEQQIQAFIAYLQPDDGEAVCLDLSREGIDILKPRRI